MDEWTAYRQRAGLFHQGIAYRRRRRSVTMMLLQSIASTELTVSPAAEATIAIATTLPNVAASGGATPGQLYVMQRHIRRWVYSNEAYGKDVVYQRTFVLPFSTKKDAGAITTATITVITEAPTLVTADSGTKTAHPATATILVSTQAPIFSRRNETNSILPFPQRSSYRTQAIHRPPVRLISSGIYQRRPDIVSFTEHPLRRPRSTWFDYFATTEQTITPAGPADIEVATEAPSFSFAGVARPTTAAITIQAQSPAIFLNGASPLAPEILLMKISAQRRRLRAAQVEGRAIIEPPTKLITLYLEPNPTKVQKPDGVAVQIVTEAPTLSVVNAVTIAVAGEATIYVATEAPSEEIQVENQAVAAVIDIVTGTPQLITGAQRTIVPVASRILVSTDAPGYSGIETVIFPGGGGVETTDIAIVTNAPTLLITKWTDEAKATDNWTAETAASSDWEDVPQAANGGWKNT